MTRQVLIATICLGLVVSASCREARQESPHSAKHSSSHARMVQVLAQRKEMNLKSDRLFGDADLREAEALLQRNDLSDWERFGAAYVAGVAAKRLGRNTQAVVHLQDAYRLIQEIPVPVQARLPGIEHGTLLELSGACLRLGETQNCVACQNSESCLFPIRGQGVHTDKTGSQMAIQCLERLLEEDAEHLTAKWLLNIAHMTLGDYPDAVPEEHRLPSEGFASEAACPRFVNVAAEFGLNTVGLSGGVIVDDFDGDGFLDVVSSDWGDAGQLLFFHNDGQGKFEKRIDEAGIRGLYGGLNLVQADYDNDGDLDIFVMRGAWRPPEGFPVNSLLQNDGRAFFRDVTFEVGLGDKAFPTPTAAWADYDNDGDLDLYVGNESFPNELFENDGHGRFRNVASRAGVENGLFTKGVVWGDYNGDDYPDLYVSNYGVPFSGDRFDSGAGLLTSKKGEPNRLYRNNRDGTFTDVAPELGVIKPLLSFPCWFWDFNNDGALDLFVATYDGTVEAVAAGAFGKPQQSERMMLYRGDGAGGFEECGETCHLNRVALTMGANFGDLNNDGFLDLFLGTGHPAYEGLMPNRMFLNVGGTRFLDVTTAGGFGHLQKGHAIAFADIDNDGDQDVYADMGGAFPGDTAANALFQNPGFGNHWIRIRLVGTKSNRCAIGARLHLQVSDAGKNRSIYRWVGSGGSFGANPLRQEIGLGQATVVRRLEVHWPASGKTQRFDDIQADQSIEIREGEANFRPKTDRR